MSLFKNKKPATPPVYHDYLSPRWGHTCLTLSTAGDGTRRACIFGKRPADGDVVLLRSATRHPESLLPGILQYRVVGQVDTPSDPGDQHFCTLRFMEKETNEADGKDPR